MCLAGGDGNSKARAPVRLVRNVMAVPLDNRRPVHVAPAPVESEDELVALFNEKVSDVASELRRIGDEVDAAAKRGTAWPFAVGWKTAGPRWH